MITLREDTAIFLQIILSLSFTDSEGCRAGEVRLVANGSCEHGIVQVCLGNQEVTVCGDGWGQTETNVVCTQLGYSLTGSAYFNFTKHPISSAGATMTLPSLACSGNETQITNCKNSMMKCDSQAQVTCAPTNASIRLVDGLSHMEGRVEVCLDNLWKSACSDQWGDRETDLACRELGIGNYSATQGSSEGVRPISHVINCSHSSPPEVAFIKCRINTDCHTNASPYMMCSESPIPLTTAGSSTESTDQTTDPTTKSPEPTMESPATTTTTTTTTKSPDPTTESTESPDPTTASPTTKSPDPTTALPTYQGYITTEEGDPLPNTAISIIVGVLFSATIIAATSTAAGIYIVVLKRKTSRVSFCAGRATDDDDIVEIDHTIYDNPIECTTRYTTQELEEEKLDFPNPMYDSPAQCVASPEEGKREQREEEKLDFPNPMYDSPAQCVARYTIPEEGEREQEEEKLDFPNPTYETLDYAAGEYEMAIKSKRPSSPMGSAKFDESTAQ